VSRVTTAIFHCPFCADEDLRPVAEPAGAWACQACARVFTVDLVTVDTARIPGRLAEEAALERRTP
jgi:ribosomal protein L37AE/L43A